MIVANIMTFGRTYDTRSFEFSVKTDNLSAGSSTATQFRLPLINIDFEPFNINWGDNTSNFITGPSDQNLLHQYYIAGTYNVKCSGIVGGLIFSNSGDRLKILNISKADGLIISIDSVFNGCANMTWTALQAPKITTNSFLNLFRSCTNFNGNIGNWNTANVTNMSSMFQSATNFNQNIGNWNTLSVTIMDSMFRSATNFNQDLNDWNVQNVTNMSLMFILATNFNGNISSWDTANVTQMGAMFNSAANFNQNIGNWNTNNVTSMGQMFQNAINFNQNIGNWNTGSATTMLRMFENAPSFNQNIGSWNVSNVLTFTLFMGGKTPATFSAVNLDAIYNGWSLRSVKTPITITFGTAKYTAASSTGRAILTDAPNNWVITDGGI